QHTAFSSARSGPLRHLHSSPTRRSSDLHALAQFAGPGHEIQALGFLVLVLAVHRARHVDGSSWSCLGCASSSVLIGAGMPSATRSEEHTSELQSRENLVCRLLLEKKKPN